ATEKPPSPNGSNGAAATEKPPSPNGTNGRDADDLVTCRGVVASLFELRAGLETPRGTEAAPGSGPRLDASGRTPPGKQPPVPAPRGHAAAVRAETDADLAHAVFEQRRHRSPGRRVPHPRRALAAAGDHPAAVRAERRGRHPGAVPEPVGEREARFRIPDPGR